ncbi:MAG: hypothetical protein K0V04_03440 [Deltaproteobacteria bacterium]|nr:hypothetical protein [Deltaproteobacteria bacterium]
MARHRLDLLPLLDVFMVVLFVFATIDERRLDESTRGEAQARVKVEELQGALQAATEREQTQRRQAQAQQAASTVRNDEALAEVKREAEHLRKELQKVRETLVEQQSKARADLAKAGVPEEALRRVDVLSRVLDKYSVFEIELVGDTTGDGSIVSRCCYRADPLDDRWIACGEVPGREDDRDRWLEEGAGGLAAALRRTKGGNAMTLVRQDHAAGHRIASRLVEQLRDRFADHDFYAEEEPVLTLRCAL